MDSTVKLMDDHRSSSDNKCGYNSQVAVVVSSTVSEDLIGLNIKSKSDLTSVVNKSNSIDDDILTICANEEDTKFVDDILIGERPTEIPVRSTKRRREKFDLIEPSPAPKSKRKREARHSQPQKRKSSEMLESCSRRTKSMPLPNEGLQMSEISSSTKSEAAETKQPDGPSKMSDLFESNESKKIADIFGNPCLKYLNNDCEHEKCILGHELPDPKNLRKSLNEIPVDNVRIALNSHVRSFDRLLDRYFCTFTEYFGDKGHKADLVEMMSICKNQEGHMQSNCAHVMDGLVRLGMSYSDALVLVLNCHNEMSEKSMFVITALITDKRNDNVARFLDDLKSFYGNMKFRFNATIINRLMQICLDLPYDGKWYDFVRKVVNEWTDIGNLNLDLVYDFCSMTPRRSALIRKQRSNLH